MLSGRIGVCPALKHHERLGVRNVVTTIEREVVL